MLTHLDRVVIAVSDEAVAVDHYSQLLGRTASWRGALPVARCALCLFQLDGVTLQLLAPAGDAPASRELAEWLDREGEGVLGLEFGAPDLDSLASELRGRGIGAGAPVEIEALETGGAEVRRWRQLELPTSDTRGTRLAIREGEPRASRPLAPLLAEEATAVAGLDHVVLTSADLAAVRHLYGETLGLRLALDRCFEERGLRILFFRLGGITVEVVGSLRDTPASPHRDRFGGLAWRVADIPAARERLLEQGFAVSEHRAGVKPGTWVCTVRSPTHGVPTLLIGPGFGSG